MGNVTPRIMDFTINVPFYGSELYVVNHDGEPYTPMKPIVDGMGMDWASQFTKMKQRFKSTVVEITMVAGDGKSRKMICLALRKLAAWLNTISPNKVRPEIRERVIRYQEECDDVLYEYWTKGKVVNPRKKTTVDERTPLRDAVNMLVSKKHMMYPEAYAMIHQRFNVGSIEDLKPEQIPMAIEYVHRIALEGELLPREPVFTPVPVSDPQRSASRVMLYLDEKGVVQGTLPLQEDQVVMSFEGFVSYFRNKGWVVLPRDEVAKGLLGAVDNLH